MVAKVVKVNKEGILNKSTGIRKAVKAIQDNQPIQEEDEEKTHKKHQKLFEEKKNQTQSDHSGNGSSKQDKNGTISQLLDGVDISMGLNEQQLSEDMNECSKD